MKIRGFLNRLRKLSNKDKQQLRKWMKYADGDHCPITKVVLRETKEEYAPAGYNIAISSICLDKEVASNIVEAADCKNNTKDLNRTQKRYHKLLTEALK